MRAEQEAKAEQMKGLTLGNKIKQFELENKPAQLDIERRYKEALIAKANALAKGGSSPAKANGMLANFKSSHPNATPEETQVFADKLLEAQMKHLNSVTNRSDDLVAGGSFDKLPTDEKKRAVGLVTAMNLDPTEGLKLLRSGKSLQDIAEEKGYNLEELTPVYPLGTENVKQLQKRSGFVNEIKNLENNIIGGMGEYQNKLFGYSLEQMADAVKGDNPDKQGKVLAARALQPELAALRLKVAGGNIGIEAIRELQNKSLGNLKIMESLVDGPTYVAMQKYITKYLEEAAGEYQKTMENYGKLKTGHKKSNTDMGEDPLGLF
jgi:hypothetical protein